MGSTFIDPNSGPGILCGRFIPQNGSGGDVERLPAPTDLTVDVDGDTITVAYTEVVGAVSYERRLNNGPWIPYELSAGYQDIVADGTHVVRVRAVDEFGVKGLVATSDSFVVDVSPTAFHYLRPGGVDTYLRPGGVDTYNRP